MGTVILDTSKTVATEMEIQFLNTWIMFPRCCHRFGSAFFCSKEGGANTFVYIVYVQVIFYTQRHCHVRIEKGPVQTVAIILEAHNFLEYHYML